MPSRPSPRSGARRRCAALGVLTGLVLLGPPAVLPAVAEGEPGGEARGEGEVLETTRCQPLQSNGVAPPRSWATERLGADRVHDLATGRGVTIAVIDTGVQAEGNPALAQTTVSAINFAGFDQTVEPGTDLLDCRHGTQVTSLIVGAEGLDDRTDFEGVAPEATVIAMRSLQRGPAVPENGETPEETAPEPIWPTVDAVRAAIELDVDVINISQTTPTSSEQYREAIQDALAAGIVVVAAAGNRPGDPLPYPAAYSGVIAVGATTSGDQPAGFSQSHEDLEVTVSAPGQDVLAVSPGPPGGEAVWENVSGTSFAAPQVSGVVALLLEREPDLTPAQVAERLRRTADPIPTAVPDDLAGWGVVNPLLVLTDVVGEDDPAPGPVASPTAAEDYRDRPPADRTARDTALVLAAAGVAVVVLATVLVAALPAGRRRRWRPSSQELPPR